MGNQHLATLFLLIILMGSCQESEEYSSIDPVIWENRMVDPQTLDSMELGASYLSAYSEIYSQTEHRTHNLTATISMRNTNKRDSIYISNAEYFHTNGTSIHKYFDGLIYIAPMETIEIVIDELDQEGGTGTNFLFDWKIKPGSNEPLFEAVMISTYGQQGLSFTTEGKRIE